jgi:hypothetical protein
MREVSPARELRPKEIAAAMDGVLRPHEIEPDRIEAPLPSPRVQKHAADLALLAEGSRGLRRPVSGERDASGAVHHLRGHGARDASVALAARNGHDARCPPRAIAFRGCERCSARAA